MAPSVWGLTTSTPALVKGVTVKLLKPSLYVVGVVQIVLGIALLVPGLFADMMGMDTAPE